MIVNLRANVARNCGDVDAYSAECEAARAAQTVPFAVAPRQTVQSRRGVLGGGQPCAPEDFEDHRVFERHVRDGRILESFTMTTTPKLAT